MKKLFLLFIISNMLSLAPAHAMDPITFGALGAAALGGSAYLYNKADRTLPTLEEANLVSFIPVEEPEEGAITDGKAIVQALKARRPAIIQYKKGNDAYTYRLEFGIADFGDTTHVTVCSFGYSNNRQPYSWTAFRAIGRTGGGAFVVFDNPCNNDPRRFNFCGEGDQHILDSVLRKIVDVNPDTTLSIFGGCQGGANSLTYATRLAQEPNHPLANKITAIITESPPASVRDAISVWPCAHALVSAVLPNYRQSPKVSLEEFATWPAGMRFFIGSIPHDTVSKLPKMTALVASMRQSGCETTHFVSGQEGLWHGKLFNDPEFRNALRAFRTSIAQSPSEN